jgi:hypothetical protein
LFKQKQEKRMTEAITDMTPLSRSLRIRSRQRLDTEDIGTLSDAAMYIMRLPQEEYHQLHWKLALSSLEAASAARTDDDLLRYATDSMANALKTDHLLIEDQ